MIGSTQDFDIMPFSFGRKLNIDLAILNHLVLNPVFKDHFQHNQDIFNRFLTESVIELSENKVLHHRLFDMIHLPEYREQVILN